MNKAITILFIGLLILALGSISFADDDNTSTVFKGTGHSRSYYSYSDDYDNHRSSFRGFKSLEALNLLYDLDDFDDDLDDLDLELDKLDRELSKLGRFSGKKHHYDYDYDYDYAYAYDYDNDFDFDFDFDFGHGISHSHSNHHVYFGENGHNFGHCNNMDIDFEDGEIYITHSGRKSGAVKITDDYELFVNGKQIKTNDEQQRLIEEFYNSAEDLHKYAGKIGSAGAEIGLEGARLGVSVIGGLFKLILPGYDTDDLERDMERKASRLEYKASLLEKDAEALEHIAYDMEDIAEELKHEIPELRKLRWF